jgi:flagellar protein FliO/FliZ
VKTVLRNIPSSVTRWLTVVVGCAALEAVQPMIAADSTPLSPERSEETVLYPAGSSSATGTAPSAAKSGPGATWIFTVVVIGAAAGFWYWRRRGGSPLRKGGLISIEDTRALGNRQFLVVAECDGRRFLLGVAPGNIQMLSPLDSKEDALDDQDEV